MKRLTATFLAVIGLFLLLALAAAPADSLAALKQLGISEDEARQSVWYSLSGGYFSYPAKPSLKQIPPSERAALVNLIGKFARTYAESESFLENYREYREERKPTPPDPPTTVEQDRQSMKEQYQRSIKETEQVMASMPLEQKRAMEETLNMMKEQLKALDAPDNPMFSNDMNTIKQQGYQAQLQDYKSSLAQWEKTYPQSPNQMIQLRLKQFLSESAGVDFDAKLKRRADGKMIFENPAYESKPPQWKLCYRLGRETVEAARSFANQWLNDIEGTF